MAKPAGSPGNGPNKPTGSLTLRLVVDQNSDGLPNWADQISFDVTASDGWTSIDVTAVQDGKQVYGAQLRPGPDGQPAGFLGLESGLWASGAAACTATLVKSGENKSLSVLEFAVGA